MTATTSMATDVRQRIIDSAIELFSSRGYTSTSIREIAQSAQTTKPMIYYYFGSKEGLYSSIVRVEFERLTATLDKVAGEARGLEEGIRTFVSTYFRFFLTGGKQMRVIYRELFDLGDGVISDLGQTYFLKVKASLQRLLETHKQRGYRVKDLEGSALAILGILNMFLLRRAIGGRPFKIRTAVEQVMKVYLRGLLAAEETGRA